MLRSRWLFLTGVLAVLACTDTPVASDLPVAPRFAKGGKERPVVLVNPNERGNGTATTIREGIEMVAAGGRVMVKPGRYAETLVIRKGLTLEGIEPENGPVLIAPTGAPTIALQVATSEPVVLRNLTLQFGGANGIRGDSAVDMTVERVSVLAVNPPTGRGYAVSAVNDPNLSGAQARLVVRESFVDGSIDNFAPGTAGIPQMFGIVSQGDVDAVFEHNMVRRVGGACILAIIRADGGGAMNTDILRNDLDLCHPTGRVASVIVGAPATLPASQITATGTVNVIGNAIANSSSSCLPANALVYEFGTGVIEHNVVSHFVQTCSASSNRSNPAAIYVGSTRKIGGVPLPAVSPTVRFNDIVGNMQSGLRIGPNQPVSLDARCNWWGDASGPSGVGTGSGDTVVVDAGGARPILTPFATAPIATGDGCHLDFSLWSNPVNLGTVVNTAASESNPALSSDQLALYFQSTRAGGLGGVDLWVSRRPSLDSPWQTPVNLGATINGAGNDYAPNLSTDGLLLFFASDRPGGSGLTDIYISHRSDPTDDFAWTTPVALGSSVNTALADQAPASLGAPEPGANLYFSRGPTIGTLQDIYKVFITPEGETPAPAVLVTELSLATANDARPTVRSDGREVLFFSDRAGGFGGLDLWVSNRGSVGDPWSAPVNAGAPINSTAADQHPSLSLDGRTLVFSSNRTGSVGGSADIWMATRVPIAP